MISVLMLAFFSGCAAPEQKPKEFNVPIKAAIIYNLGGAQAVAREDFSLLNKDAVEIWKEKGLVKDEKDLWIQIAMDRLATMENKNRPYAYVEALKSNVIKTVTTDFEGNATFENIPPGDYYIFAITETRGGQAVWNYKITVNPEIKTVLLDNKNAYYAR